MAVSPGSEFRCTCSCYCPARPRKLSGFFCGFAPPLPASTPSPPQPPPSLAAALLFAASNLIPPQSPLSPIVLPRRDDAAFFFIFFYACRSLTFGGFSVSLFPFPSLVFFATRRRTEFRMPSLARAAANRFARRGACKFFIAPLPPSQPPFRAKRIMSDACSKLNGISRLKTAAVALIRARPLQQRFGGVNFALTLTREVRRRESRAVVSKSEELQPRAKARDGRQKFRKKPVLASETDPKPIKPRWRADKLQSAEWEDAKG